MTVERPNQIRIELAPRQQAIERAWVDEFGVENFGEQLAGRPRAERDNMVERTLEARLGEEPISHRARSRSRPLFENGELW